MPGFYLSLKYTSMSAGHPMIADLGVVVCALGSVRIPLEKQQRRLTGLKGTVPMSREESAGAPDNVPAPVAMITS